MTALKFYFPFYCLNSACRAVDNLADFVQPILDGICALTGWKATLIAGGPEPVHQGKLNVIRYVEFSLSRSGFGA